MLPEYDFSNAVRGKYYERVKESSNVVVIDPDVAELFPNAEAVNGALRVLATVARRGVIARRPNNRMQLTNGAKAGRRSARS